MLTKRVSSSQQTRPSDIAIIGFACRFPGAANADEFWDNLKTGVDSISTIPSERWDINKYYSTDTEEDFKTITKRGGFIDGVGLFDPRYFNISEQRAKLMDPQQRLVLELAAETINHAGYRPKEIYGSQTGVFAAAATGDYGLKNDPLGQDYDHISYHGALINNRNGFLGNLPNMIASIISYYFNLNGPSYIISSACSSSLVCVHIACQSILREESDMAIATGIQLYHSPNVFIGTSKTGTLSPEGKCKTFSKDADGFVLSEGVGACLLKRVDKAINDGDTIYSIIKASAVNNDGRTMSVLMPNVYAQKEVILQALKRGAIDASSITYLEANGTALQIGDPLEVEAATLAYRSYTRENQYCAVGSVEPNIGHAAHAAGIASLIKVILSLINKQIPPTLNCAELNPKIDFTNSPFYPNTELIRWKRRYNCRRAGINAFGFGGTNCHLIVEEFDPKKYDDYVPKREPLPSIRFNRKRYWVEDGLREKLFYGKNQGSYIHFEENSGAPKLREHKLEVTDREI